MRMSTRGRFGLRALLHLTEDANGGPLPISQLSDMMEVSSEYLMQLFVKLRQAGLVESVRGPHGGFKLARPPSEITVGDIVRAVEGPIAVVACVSKRDSYRGQKVPKYVDCPKIPSCMSRIMWLKLTEEITEILDGTNLQDIVAEAHRRGIAGQPVA